jgi:hypothetical protein
MLCTRWRVDHSACGSSGHGVAQLQSVTIPCNDTSEDTHEEGIPLLQELSAQGI